MGGRPQVVVYPKTYVQQYVATYNAWAVDHLLWSTKKYIRRTIRGNVGRPLVVLYQQTYVAQYVATYVAGGRAPVILFDQ